MTVLKRANSILIDATGQAHTGPGKLLRVLIYSSDTEEAIVNIYDDTAAGTADRLTLPLMYDPPDVSGETMGTRVYEVGAEFENGLSVVITGAAAASEVMLVLER